MNYSFSLAFANRDVGVYVFPEQDEFQKSHIEDFLCYLNRFCRYTIIDDLDRVRDFNKQNSIIIFLVASLSNFQCLKELGYLDASLNIVAYFLYNEEFQQVNSQEFRIPIKALSFNIVCPNENEQGLIYPNKTKILDIIFHKTIRNKYANIEVGNDIPAYTGLDLKQKFSEMRAIGLYFRFI